MNKVCIYAICKDEIKFVDKWLDSMSEADYIVVLDTGSTDGTYEKLKSDPRVTKVKRKVISPWRFDVARNESMKLVPKDANILFCTDFDEILTPGWGDLVRASWKENTCRGHYQYIWSHTDAGNPGVTYVYDKMHNREYKWWYPVHEVLGGIDGALSRVDYETAHYDQVIDFGDKIVLHHYPDPEKSRSSYLDLLLLRYNENPGECYSAYLLGREYGTREMYDEALRMFEETINLPSAETHPIIKRASLGYLGDLYRMKGSPAEAIVSYTLQIQMDGTYREPYLCLAELYNDMGMYEVALGYARHAEAHTYRHIDWSERDSTWNEKLDDVYSVAYSNLNEYDKALPHVIKALKFSPNDERIRENYLTILSHIKV